MSAPFSTKARVVSDHAREIGTNENFNRRLRDECLNMEWFTTRREAAMLIEAFHVHYNTVQVGGSASAARGSSL